MGPCVRRDDSNQLRLALLGDGLNSFLISLMPSESRGHSQEKESLAQLVALVRDLTSPDLTSPDLGSLVAAA